MAGLAENERPSGLVLKDAFRILKHKPLAHLRSGSIEAFDVETVSIDYVGAKCFALIGQDQLLPRYHIAAMNERVASPHAIRFVDWGLLPFDGDDARHRPVFIFEKPGGDRFVNEWTEKVEPLHETVVIKGILTPLLHMLEKYNEQMLTYRSVRPNNLFWTDDSKKTIQAGECIVSPSAYFQPVAFEPIESAMADPTARGNGRMSDDMYALGVTLAYALMGRCVLTDKTDEEIIRTKLEQGSYTALLSGVRIAPAVEEAIRGLLRDDPSNRWTPENLISWIEDRKSPLASVSVAHRLAVRGYPCNGQNFRNLRLLVWEFYKIGTRCVFDITSVGFHNWLTRSCGLETLAEEVKELQKHLVEFYGMSLDPASADAHKVMVKICSHIDPYMPLFYKGFSFNVLGIGPALICGQNDFKRKQLLAELIASGITASGSSFQLTSPKGDDMGGFFTRIAGFLRLNEYGYSIERCFYDLNKFLFCQSDFIYNDAVFKSPFVLIALEQEAIRRNGDYTDFPFDRHIAAFVATHSGNQAVPWLEGLNSQYSEETKALAVLNFYAAIQDYYKVGPLPNLCEWFVNFLDLGLAKFHSRFQQERTEQIIRRKAKEGSLVLLANLADNPHMKQADEIGYHNAKQLYLQLDQLEVNIDGRLQKVVPESERIANVISIILSVVLLTVFGCVTLFKYLG